MLEEVATPIQDRFGFEKESGKDVESPERGELFVMVRFEPPISAPAVPVNDMPVPDDTDVVPVLYNVPPAVEFTVPAPSVEKTGLLVNV